MSKGDAMKLQELLSLKGKTALITGGGRGIGEFIATGLAEAGADVIIVSRKMKNLEDAAREIGKNFAVKVLPLACDVGKEEDIEKMLEAARTKFARIDILVNNAGVTWGSNTLDFPLAKWDQVFNVNVRGVWILTQRIARLMKEQGGGNIINVSSVMGSRGADDLTFPAVPYSATKAAINMLTKDLAVKLASFNIRVNAIAPGFFNTDMTTYLKKEEFSAAREKILQTIPLRKFGDLDEMKGVAVFLASDASIYVTGQVLAVDGGFLAT